jgi:hypothetical protein
VLKSCIFVVINGKGQNISGGIEGVERCTPILSTHLCSSTTFFVLSCDLLQIEIHYSQS